MKSRAIIKQSGDWWIGWLIDIPGVNAQEKTREEVVNSLIEGAKDMMKINEEDINNNTTIETIEIPI